ncbi:MAG: SRPBCC family protein [Phycisphaerales bacterium]|nr:SRPBCC family protein [Hyphomonadaceae bacterium]
MELGHAVGADTFRLERTLKAPIEKVWAFFTEADKRSRWFTAGDDITANGQTFNFAFGHHRITDEKPPARWAHKDGSQPDTLMLGRVLAFEPPRLLAFTWGDGDEHVSEVRFEFTPRGDETLLVLTHSKIDTRGNLRNFGGGWTAHLETLADVLAGRKSNRFWANVVEAHEAYERTIEG